MSRNPAHRILIDTGPLIAIFNGEDSYHQTCLAALAEMNQPLYTCWPVITEAAWLLRKSTPAVIRLLASINGDFLEVLPLAGGEAEAIAASMTRYKNIQLQLADAALAYLAERERIETIFTLDRKDFSIYRTSRKRAFRILPEVD
jgi:uncharacterized protein